MKNQVKHKKLLNSIQHITNKKNPTLRNEIITKPSKFHVLEEDAYKQEIKIEDLFASFYGSSSTKGGNKSKTSESRTYDNVVPNDPQSLYYLEKKVEKLSAANLSSSNIKSNKTLSVPPNKCELERTLISAGYEATVQEKLDPWNDIIRHNRLAETITFPLESSDIKINRGAVLLNTQLSFNGKTENSLLIGANGLKIENSLNNSVVSFDDPVKAMAQFDHEMDECLKNASENTFKPGQLYTEAEQKYLKSMSLEEAKARQKELAKFKALVNYNQLKARQQNKIKSKKYRRIQRREREKKSINQLETLKNENPLAYKERLEKLELSRIHERATLKHKNAKNRKAGKWARKMTALAKNDPHAKEALEQLHKINKQLLTKSVDDSENSQMSENEDENAFKDETGFNKMTNDLPPNLIYTPAAKVLIPNVSRITAKKSSTAFESLNKDHTALSKIAQNNPWIGNQGPNNDQVEYMKTTKEIKKPSISPFISALNSSEKPKSGKSATSAELSIISDPDSDDSDSVDVKNMREQRTFLDIKKKRTLGIPSQRNLIAEAFYEDQLMDDIQLKDIQAEKDKDKALLKSELMKSYGLRTSDGKSSQMPGWGNWAGFGAEEETSGDLLSKKARRKLRLKTKAREIRDKELENRIDEEIQATNVRRDKHLPHVVIDESKDRKIAPIQVSEIPHEYDNVEMFESTLRNPIGYLWNPMTVTKRFIRPPIINKLGHMIKPISSSQLLKQKN